MTIFQNLNLVHPGYMVGLPSEGQANPDLSSRAKMLFGLGSGDPTFNSQVHGLTFGVGSLDQNLGLALGNWLTH